MAMSAASVKLVATDAAALAIRAAGQQFIHCLVKHFSANDDTQRVPVFSVTLC